MKNEWIDEEGNIFLIFSRKEAQEKLNLSDKTVAKAFKQLRETKLIYEKKQGFKKNNIIYVGKITILETEKLRIKNRKIYDVIRINIIKIIIVIRIVRNVDYNIILVTS